MRYIETMSVEELEEALQNRKNKNAAYIAEREYDEALEAFCKAKKINDFLQNTVMDNWVEDMNDNDNDWEVLLEEKMVSDMIDENDRVIKYLYSIVEQKRAIYLHREK